MVKISVELLRYTFDFPLITHCEDFATWQHTRPRVVMMACVSEVNSLQPTTEKYGAALRAFLPLASVIICVIICGGMEITTGFQASKLRVKASGDFRGSFAEVCRGK